MNRRKLFGILAAPVAAANIPSVDQSKTRTNLKPYSDFNYSSIFSAWGGEYIRKSLGAVGDVGIIASTALFDGNPTCYSCHGIPGFVTLTEIRQAFADACLNGEVPGVYWA